MTSRGIAPRPLQAIGPSGRRDGPPGPREPAALRFHAAYVRDPDGDEPCALEVG